MLRHIDRRRHNEYAGQAALHGVKLPLKGEATIVKAEPLTQAEEDAIQKALENTRLRKLREHGRY